MFTLHTGTVYYNRNAITMIMRDYAHAKFSRKVLEKNTQEPSGHETIKPFLIRAYHSSPLGPDTHLSGIKFLFPVSFSQLLFSVVAVMLIHHVW